MAGAAASAPPREVRPQSTHTSTQGRGSAPASKITRQDAADIPSSSRKVANTGLGGSAKHVRPSKQAYYDKKAAMRVVNKIGDLPTEQLTEEQVRSLEWARGVVASLGRPAAAAPKRQRSAEQAGGGVTKRPRTGGHKYPTFRDVVKGGGEVLAIIDRGEEEGTIPKEKWRLVEEAIAEIYLQVLDENRGPPPLCHDSGWYQGRAKLIACEDHRSAQLYRLAVSKVGEVWPGAKLEAVNKEDIPSRPRARVWIPARPAEPERIERIFRSCNKDLPSHNWRVGKIEDPVENRRQVLLILNAESLAPLAQKYWTVRFGFNDATIRIYRSDEPRLDLSEESDKSGLRSGGEEGLPSSQCSSDSERLSGLGPLFYEEDLLADDTEGEEIEEADVDVTMVEVKRTDSDEADPDQPPPL
ncbi:uncharacterized protein LOC118741893 [Rhagoletis pomonella]|uniref:uncharacterized protein LOC118741893 n=1 Tax=Rhagoletis pomonella TaxID=28610 RepID=UPI0017848B4B|nr:uncharacterized protein LOC118741893 [Rhagoletis pomonella]